MSTEITQQRQLIHNFADFPYGRVSVSYFKDVLEENPDQTDCFGNTFQSILDGHRQTDDFITENFKDRLFK